MKIFILNSKNSPYFFQNQKLLSSYIIIIVNKITHNKKHRQEQKLPLKHRPSIQHMKQRKGTEKTDYT